MGGVQTRASGTVTRVGVGHGARGKVRGGSRESNRHSAAAAGPPGCLSQAAQTFVANVVILRRLQAISAPSLEVVLLEDSSRSAEAVEHEVEHDAYERIDERCYGDARGETRLGVSEEQALNQHDHSLMQREKRRGQSEARPGILCVAFAPH